MKLNTIFFSIFVGFATAQSPAPYTDPKSGITFDTFTHDSGYFFGLNLASANSTDSKDFVATIGGKGTGWSGVSLGGSMNGKLLVVAWPSGNSVLGSFRKTTSDYQPPAVANGTFMQTAIMNGTYVNSTHWTYTFLCSNCIQSDGTTFSPSDNPAVLGYAYSTEAPQQPTNPESGLNRHTGQGMMQFDLSKAKNAAPPMMKRRVRRAKFAA